MGGKCPGMPVSTAGDAAAGAGDVARSDSVEGWSVAVVGGVTKFSVSAGEKEVLSAPGLWTPKMEKICSRGLVCSEVSKSTATKHLHLG